MTFTKIIISKWQKFFEKKRKYDDVCLDMFPYPSGTLHLGHQRNYIITDIFIRYEIIFNGKNIYRPFGWDAFGLPAENAAIQNNMHPKDWTLQNINEMKKQVQLSGLLINWQNEINTSDKDYYLLNQQVFKLFFDQGLIYKNYDWLNWDESEKSVLANEQVINGLGWRSGLPIQKKLMAQWFFKVKNFANELYNDLFKINMWPSKIIKMQENWIGKHEGFIINLAVYNKDNIFLSNIQCFSKTPEILHQSVACCLSLNHELSKKFFITNNINELDQAYFDLTAPKTCYWKTELIVKSKIFDTPLPVFITNKVTANYGTGVLLLIPSFSTKDEEICTELNINYTKLEVTTRSHDNVEIHAAHEFKIRDWCISRQRIWGCPIPIIYCDNCGVRCQINENTNTIKLSFKTFKELQNANVKETCTKCLKPAVCEIETLDTFFDSSWYFIRYIDLLSNNKKSLIPDKKNISKFLPIKIYVGGVEHATLHLLYARIFVKAFKKLNIINNNVLEPFHKIINQGMVLSKTYKYQNKYISEERAKELNIKEFTIEKMSKSKFNNISPEYIINKFGPDVLRLALVSDCPIDQNIIWDNNQILKSNKHTNIFQKYCENLIKNNEVQDFINKHLIIAPNKISINNIANILTKEDLECKIFFIHSYNKIVNLYENFQYNKVVAELFTLFNYHKKNLLHLNNVTIDSTFLILFIFLAHPILPFTTEYIAQNTCIKDIHSYKIIT